MAEQFSFPDYTPDPHAYYSLTVRELSLNDFDFFGDSNWALITWPDTDNITSETAIEYLENTEQRIKDKFLTRFYNAEIEPRVPVQWRYNFTSYLVRKSPKYVPYWKAWAQGVNYFMDEDKYGKNRRVYSDFPATQLDSSVNDYASNANDYQYEDITLGNVLDKIKQIDDISDPDEMLLSELEPCFTQVMSMTMGGL